MLDQIIGAGLYKKNGIKNCKLLTSMTKLAIIAMKKSQVEKKIFILLIINRGKGKTKIICVGYLHIIFSWREVLS